MGLFSNKKKTDGGDKPKEVKKEAPKKEAKAQPGKGSMKDLYKDESKAKEPVKAKSDKKSVSSTSNAYKVLIRPLITEKATDLGVLNKYAFEISPRSNKIEVAKAIKDVYGVVPTSVNVVKVKGKTVTRGRYSGKRKDWKKAIVTLPKGKTIQVYEGI